MQNLITGIFASFIFSMAFVFIKPQPATGIRNIPHAEELQGEDYFFLQHSFPYGRIDYDAHRAAAALFLKSRTETFLKTEDQPSWQFAGPINIGGRVVDVEWDPTTTSTAYCAAASGGIFKSTDWCGTWFPIFDEQATLSIGDIAIAPSDHNILYVGTGEANGGSGSLTYDANGVYKSSDGGASWTNIGLQNTHMIGRVAIHPTDPDIVFVAAMGDLYGNTIDRGLYKTTDGGSNWTKVLYVNDSTGAVDVVVNPQNPNIVFATTWMRTRHANNKDYAGVESGVWKSTNGGDSFTRLNSSNGLPPTNLQYSRIGIDLCASSPNVLYAMYINDAYDFGGIYKSTNDGASWDEVNDNILYNSMSGQGYWYGRVECDPTDPEILYVIGFDMYKTTNGGNYFFNTFSGAHVDQHAISVHPLDHNFVLLGNDGGLHVSYGGGDPWSHVPTLPISQIYRSEIDNLNPDRIFVGLQDNGTSYTPSGANNDFQFIFGGDGFQSRVKHDDPNTILVGYQYGSIWKSYDGGYYWYPSYYYGITGTGNWNYPLAVDPQSNDVVYTGTQKVFRSDNFGDTWNEFSPELTQLDVTANLVYGTITFIDVSPLNSNIIYAGTDDGKVWNTLDGGSNWNEVDNGLPVRWVTCVATDPFDEHIAYATISGYRFHDNMNHVYMTNDDGQTWNDIGSNLPDIPCSSILADPLIAGTLYLATDVGVYYSTNSGTNWNPLGTGMPIVPCVDLKLHAPTRTLVVGTYGRSVYKLDLNLISGIQSSTENDFSFHVISNLIGDGIANVVLESPAADHVGLSLFSSDGKLIREESIAVVEGENKFSFPMKNLSQGIYFLKASTSHQSISEKVFVQ